MPVVPLTLPNHSYDITIEFESLSQVGNALTARGIGAKSPKVLIVSHPIVFKFYGEKLLQGLKSAGFVPHILLLAPGERFKTAKTLQKIYDSALEHHLERNSLMIALGGGVIGDMTGFAAATWLRGIDFVQVPTSLLAMVDAAIGGKTAINHPRGKNLIGAFHQPRLVWIDPQVLETLPGREFRAAMAEVIKYGAIWDQELFQLLEQAPRLDQLRYLSSQLLSDIIYRCAKAKAEIVMQDEKEGGVRALLNFGHTIGHGIEISANYRINHGEAVAIGMVLASQIATDRGFWDAHDRLFALVKKAKLPHTIPPEIDCQAVMQAMMSDKKVESEKLRLILPTAIGTATITNTIPLDFINQVLFNSVTKIR